MSAFEDPYGDYETERDRRTVQAIDREKEFSCLYCMDLRVVWEPDVMDAPIDDWNPRKEKPCPMCKARERTTT